MTSRLWVVATDGEVRWSLLPFEVVSDEGCLAVLGTSLRASTGQVVFAVERLLRGGRAALSDPVDDPHWLPEARRQVAALLPVADPGSCATPASARERVVLRALTRALDELPPLGGDPFAALSDYDDRRGGELVETLRTWLVSMDRTDVASELGIHVNTLKYRLRRITEICGVELHRDSPRRVELAVRLLA